MGLNLSWIMVIFLIIFSQFDSTRPIAVILSQRLIGEKEWTK